MSEVPVRRRRWTPPTLPIPSGLDRMDRAVDDWFEAHLRGRPAVDRLMYTASAVGDHGLVWLALAGLQAIRQPGRRQRRLLRTAIGLGVESAVVNGPVKWLFDRTRPIHEGPRPLHLRSPLTSSFPSGHASSAFFGAALLRDGDPWWPLYYAIAVVVASSRVHVKIHHASDVVAGSVIGAALGELARRLVSVQRPMESTPRTRR
jgi:undecaprenyl-diphosphatase